MLVSRQSAVAVVKVKLDEPISSGWKPGPWPLPLPARDLSGHVHSKSADVEARSDVLQSQVRPLLYEGEGGVRWHRNCSRRIAGWQAEAVEAIRLPPSLVPGTYLVAIHLRRDSGDDDPSKPVEKLANLRRKPQRPDSADGPDPDVSDDTTRSDYEGLLHEVLPGSELSGKRHAFLVTYTLLDQCPPRTKGIPSELYWPRLLASANDESALHSSLRSPMPGPNDVELSKSWSAAVLKSGAAFVGLNNPDDAFHPSGEAYVHSVYLDSLLVALIQRNCLVRIAEDLADSWRVERSIPDTGDLEFQSIRFRGQVWWTEISDTVISNQLLGALQDAYRLTQQVDNLHGQIRDMAQYSDGRRAARINTALNLLVAGGFGLGIAALAADPGWGALLWGLGLGALAFVGLLLWDRRRSDS